jgi:Arc/MetJ-type ribon-helix-helix transcriptional regulator
MSRAQLNVRVSEELEKAIDEKRIALRATMGPIPSRSDVLRFALESYLGITLAETEGDRRSTTGPEKRRAGSPPTHGATETAFDAHMSRGAGGPRIRQPAGNERRTGE